MKVRLLSPALRDLKSAADFYEAQGEGLGNYFFDSLFSDIDSLSHYAGIHARVYGHYRLLSKRFPYAIYYKLDDEYAVVHRVLDMRRSSRATREALE